MTEDRTTTQKHLDDIRQSLMHTYTSRINKLKNIETINSQDYQLKLSKYIVNSNEKAEN